MPRAIHATYGDPARRVQNKGMLQDAWENPQSLLLPCPPALSPRLPLTMIAQSPQTFNGMGVARWLPHPFFSSFPHGKLDIPLPQLKFRAKLQHSTRITRCTRNAASKTSHGTSSPCTTSACNTSSMSAAISTSYAGDVVFLFKGDIANIACGT